ncbi:hypothetical protein RhiLY_12627 [Ceratobasidium sp. AG-Ba]|nr:hypothetical protein RhiLY_12627 [Ceratobasidium sp. AG-Ba]
MRGERCREQPLSSCTSSGTQRMDPPSRRRSSGARLTSSLYGYSAGVLVAANNYKALPPEAKLSHISNMGDVERIGSLVQYMTIATEDNFFHALNKGSKLNELRCHLAKLRLLPVPKFIYFGGHSERDDARDEFDYLPGDYSGSGNTISLSRLSSRASYSCIRPRFRDKLDLKLVTDFCNANNFLGLQWVLKRNSVGKLCWEESEEFDPSRGSLGHRILHFASSAKHQQTYSTSKGSFFNQEFLNAEYGTTGASMVPISLSCRLETIQSRTAKSIQQYNAQRRPSAEALGQQEPQLYSSEKLDLENPQSLAELLHSL